MSKQLNVCVAGVSGWTGRAVATAILRSEDLCLSGAVSRSSAGKDAGDLLTGNPNGLVIQDTVTEALQVPTDILIDYTKPGAVKGHAQAALQQGVHVVIGTSGLTASDYADLDSMARAHGVGLVASGNFSITAALATRFALMASRYLPQCEIVDYAHSGKADAPSGTTRELAERLGALRPETPVDDLSKLIGPREARGASIGATRVHSIRLPGYTIAFEVTFGLPDERLTLRHDAGSSAAPYVEGTLLAVRRVTQRVGLVRGLDTLLFGPLDA